LAPFIMTSLSFSFLLDSFTCILRV